MNQVNFEAKCLLAAKRSCIPQPCAYLQWMNGRLPQLAIALQCGDFDSLRHQGCEHSSSYTKQWERDSLHAPSLWSITSWQYHIRNSVLCRLVLSVGYFNDSQHSGGEESLLMCSGSSWHSGLCETFRLSDRVVATMNVQNSCVRAVPCHYW